MVGLAACALVCIGLAVTARAQIVPLGRHRVLLDTLAIIPEWRFYSGASLGAAIDMAADVHLVARDCSLSGSVGGWRAVRWPAERRLHQALWNPARRANGFILSIAEDLADCWRRGRPDDMPLVQQGIPYLLLLRTCLAAPPERGPVAARQFAIVRAIGRRQRNLSIDFMSAWHRW